MTATTLAAVAIVVGAATLVVAVLQRARDREAELRRLLDLDETAGTPVVEAADRLGLLRPAADAAGVLVERVDRGRRLATRLERAHVALRPGEFALVTLVGGTLAGLWLGAVSGIWPLAAAPVVAAPVVGSLWLDARVSSRRRVLEQQLPDVLTGLAASVRGGHPLLRATELLAAESPDPIGVELDRVLAETRLGVPVVDAFARFAERSALEDLTWVVEAIRIQQAVGGKLADLLFTLADHLREREEIRREVSTLTAEGRMSTWLLGGLPVAMGLFLAITQPSYIRPLFSGAGLVLLVLAGLLVVAGVVLIQRMVRKVVL